MFQWVGGCFSDGGSFIFKWGGGVAPWGSISFGGGRGFEKNHKMGGPCPSLWETLLSTSLLLLSILLSSYSFLLLFCFSFPWLLSLFLLLLLFSDLLFLVLLFLEICCQLFILFLFPPYSQLFVFPKVFHNILAYSFNISSSISSFWPWLFNT